MSDSNADCADGRDICAFVATLAKEGERVAVIISAARIDFTLETILKRLLNPSSGTSDPLFDSDRPLGTFSAKILLSFRLGVIDSELERAITVIRKIRNDFSHSMRPEHLADSPHRERVTELIKELQGSEFYDTLLNSYSAQISPPPFCKFCTAVAVVLSSLRVLEKALSDGHNTRSILLLQPRGLIKELGNAKQTEPVP